MSTEPDNPSLSFWKAIIREHFGVLATISIFMFVTLQLLILARGNIYTANFLIAHSDKIPLFIGLFLPFFPILFVLFILMIGKIGYLIFDSEALIVFPALLTAGLFTVSITEKLMTWKMLILALAIAYVVLDFPFPSVFRKKGIVKHLGFSEGKPGNGVFRKNSLAPPIVFLTFLIVLALNLTPFNSFPLECITQTDGTKTFAAVLSVDSDFTYVLAFGGRKPLVLKTSEIASRNVAKSLEEFACKETSTTKK